MKTSGLIRVVVCVLGIAFCTSAARGEIVKIVVDDTIQPITAEYISRAIDQAARTNAQAVLIEMNTPGGLVSSTREIIEKITSSPVPVIVYVTPTGGHAGSAGIFIFSAAHPAAVAPGTAGRAAPPAGVVGPGQTQPDEGEKREIYKDGGPP